ncbi:Orc1-type DNA replication protein (nonfunctional) (plasmid) [Natrialba magadii ATCC 43099]|uniref:ORC1/cdc6 family replication initiation protein n=1 Tax=Natrialba magadii (strain ATCC 43099 / DSM 3394 / CCM 3739 / CIP 104546 / IAM 13178 / JCM 8861 / NBRC 102185 / NCIMB 2190 / MS3) TaxID=547559 RepID=D3T1P9_NATMM|nr:Orc1-type DNA replication protein (nonfunctional) [Natrialba magadii ATCC 43099]ELY26540.1 ORC1/cdc6 family replication initiation protein [Natrialba magadii ATCC 43099]
MTDSANDDRNPLFRYEDPIFRDESLLRISHLPDRDRIVGRDDQLQRVAEALNPAIFGSEPNHIVIFGKTGSGKTLISRAVTQMVQEGAQRESIDVAYILVDCGEFSTETAAVRRIAAGLNEPEQTNIDIPHRGIGTGTYSSHCKSLHT